MVSFEKIFPGNIFAHFSDKSADFRLEHCHPVMRDDLKEYLGGLLGCPAPAVASIKQIHGSEVVVIDRTPSGGDQALPPADAIITHMTGLPIAIRTADCLPVFLFDPGHAVIGLVHAGWRGSGLGILKRTVEAMRLGFDTDPSALLSVFGPCIRVENYEVGKEFLEKFPQGVEQRNGTYYLDLPHVNRLQLLEAGVKEDRIFDCGIDTCADERCYSYRREGDTGRHLSLMMIRADSVSNTA